MHDRQRRDDRLALGKPTRFGRGLARPHAVISQFRIRGTALAESLLDCEET